VQPYLSELQKRSAARVAKSKDFAYVTEDIGLVKKAMSDKTVSLNERQRLQETAETEVRRKVREAELKARKPAEEKVFDLTLKNNEVVMKEEAKPGTNDLAGQPAGGFIRHFYWTNSMGQLMDETGDKFRTSGIPIIDENITTSTNYNFRVNSFHFTNDLGQPVTVVDLPIGTNNVATSDAAAAKAPAPETLAPEEKAPLEEAEHILDDYISLMHSGGTLTAEQLQKN
jgi:hypothetical protein